MSGVVVRIMRREITVPLGANQNCIDCGLTHILTRRFRERVGGLFDMWNRRTTAECRECNPVDLIEAIIEQLIYSRSVVLNGAVAKK